MSASQPASREPTAERLSRLRPPAPNVRKPLPEAKARLVRGCEAIGALIGIGPRAAYHLVVTKQLPARKLGGQWCAVEQVLLDYVSASEAAPLDKPTQEPERDTDEQTAPARRKRWNKRRLPAPEAA